MTYDYWGLLSELHISGIEVKTRGLKTKELTGVQLLVDDYNTVSVPEFRPWIAISRYLFAELSWYMTGDRRIDKILPYSSFWNQIKNQDSTVNSQYGNLVFYRKNFYDFTSFEWAVEKLREDKSTRKALVLYNDKDFFFSSNRDLICNQYQNFLIRDNELKCFVHLRSSDAIFGLTFNIPWWSLVHQQLYLTLLKDYPDLRLGSILASIDSSHIYENKFELVENMLDSPIKEDRFLRLKKIIPLGKSFEFYKNEVFTEERDEYFENVI